MFSFLIVSIIFCLSIFDIEYFIIHAIKVNTATIEINIAPIGNSNEDIMFPVKELCSKYESPIPIGIPNTNALTPMKTLSNLIILLNSLVVIPIDFKLANSLLLSSIFVVIVLNIFVIPIREITIINPYKKIEINKNKFSIFLTSSSELFNE